MLKRVVGYHSHGIPHAGFQLLKIVVSGLVDKVLPVTPKEKNPVSLSLMT
jgi:hypothetical protein